MGNTPSKEPLHSQHASNTSQLASSTGEGGHDDDKPNLSRKRYSNSKAINIGSSQSKSSNHKKLSPPRRTLLKRAPVAKATINELDLEIGALMAQLLKLTPSDVHNYSLSADTVALTLPVFTTMETKDDDLMLLLCSHSPDGKYDGPKFDADTRKEKPKKQRLKVRSSSSLLLLTALPPLVATTKKLDIDVDSVIERLIDVALKKQPLASQMRRGKDKLPVTHVELKYILAKLRQIFLDQPTLLQLSPPVKIVGDIHGQFHDLIRIFNSCGFPPYTNYLFLGDYVDRGHKLLESILLLLCYKIKYPENFFMLRGNHELANITKIYGFYDECKRRLPPISGNHKLWKGFIDVFNSLPIGATINNKIFCIHGGLSPDLHNLEQIEQIKRPTDIPDKGLLADLLWLDPDALIRNYSATSWPKNDRGVSYCFGRKHVDQFCQQFKMDLIVRGHMVVEDGYEFFNKRKLVTVFSAPNYCGEFNNFGAVMSVDKSLYCLFELIKPQ